MEENYHFHFKCSTFPLVFTELCWNSVRNYGQFEYFILQEGDLFTTYCSGKGRNDQYIYGREHLFDVGNSNDLLEKIKNVDKKLSEFSFDDISKSERQERKKWSEIYKRVRSSFIDFGEIYFVMEPMALQSLAEFVEKICKRDGLVQDKVLHDVNIASNFSDEEKKLVLLLDELGRQKLSLHKSMEPIVLTLYELFNFISIESKVSLNQIILMTDAEINNFLDNGMIDTDELSKRLNGMILITKNREPIFEFYTGEQYKKWKNILEPEFAGEIKGTVACRGKIQGRVSLHLSWIHTTEIPKGNILVAGMTNPQMVPFIKNAGGIITDEGGLTCHAAIISREMRIPCIVGTKVATRVLKDGDLVEVDAERGVVKILKKVGDRP